MMVAMIPHFGEEAVNYFSTQFLQSDRNTASHSGAGLAKSHKRV